MKTSKNTVFLKKISFFFLMTFAFTACENWMNNDDFFKNIEEEVFEAKADRIETNVRYAIPNVMGTTEPNGSLVQKVGVPFKINAITADEYGFYKWYAFLTDDLWDPTPDDEDNTLSPFFDLSSSNSKIMYTSEKMLETLNAHALSYDVVSFGNSKNQSESDEAALNPSTTVTIKKKLNNIVIVPVCANKISVVESDPSANKAAVPINKTIKIAFSKALPLSNFATDDGLSSKITVRHRANGTFGSLDYVDISNRFDVPYFQDLDPETNTGRVLVLPLKSNEGESYYLAENSLHEITIDSSIVDSLGYSMGKDYTLTFTTSSQKDNTPPTLSYFSAGATSPFEFDKININPTSKDVNSYTAYLGNRTSADSLFFYLRAGDIASEEDLPDEEQVSSYFIRAKTLIPSSDSFTGEPMDFIEYEYIPGSIPSALENGQTFSDITGSDEGLLGTIDISSLADGLIDLQVYTADKIGNSGEDSEVDDQLRTNAHVLFIKDTTPPAAVLSNITLKTKPNGYLNEQNIGNLDIDLRQIKDFGPAGIRSETVYAIATANKNAVKPSANDANWKNVKNYYNLRGITTEIEEGNVPLTFWFKDESGNISNPVLYNQIFYDKTAPVINKLSWVYDDNSEAPAINSTSGNDRFIKIDFLEQVSGIVNINIVVKDQLTGVVDNNAINSVEIYAGLPNSSYKRSYTHTSNKFTLDAPVYSTADNTQSIYIGNLTLDSLSSKTILITLTDDADNVSVEKTIDNIVDSTAPIISNFHITNTKEKKVFGSAAVDNEKWLSYHSKGTGYCDLEFEVQEHQSGIHEFQIIQKVNGTTIPFIIEKSFGILLNDVALTNDKDFTTSVTTNNTEKTITYTVSFTNAINPIIKAKTENENLKILIKDLLLYSKDNESSVSIKVKDFVNHDSVVRADSVYIGNSADEIDSVTIKSMDETDPTGYSDAYSSILSISNSAKAIKTAGIEKITLENAQFQNTTKIFITSGELNNKELVKNEDYTIEDFTNTLFFTDKVLYGTYALKLTDIKQINQTIGTEQIRLNAANMSGYKTSKESNELIVDVENPTIDTFFLNANALDSKTESQLIKTRVHMNEDENLELVLTVRLTEEGTGISKIKLPAWNALTDQLTGTNASEYESIEINRRTSFDSKYDIPYTVDFENRELLLTAPFVSTGYDNTLYIRGIPVYKNTDLDDNYGETRFRLSVTDLVGRSSVPEAFSIVYKDSIGTERKNYETYKLWRGPKIIEASYDSVAKTARIKLTHIYPYITKISAVTYKYFNGALSYYDHNHGKSLRIKMIRADGSELIYTEDENAPTDLTKETLGYPTVYKLPELFDYFDFDYNEEVTFEISGITITDRRNSESCFSDCYLKFRFFDTLNSDTDDDVSTFVINNVSVSQ